MVVGTRREKLIEKTNIVFGPENQIEREREREKERERDYIT